MMCGSSGLFLIPGLEHLLSTNVFYAHMRPFGYLHLSPPVKMALCLLMNVVQQPGHGEDQPLRPCKCHFLSERLPLLPATRYTWLQALGSNQPPDFQMTPVPDSWLGCLKGCSDRYELAPSEGDALAWEPPGPQGLGKCQPQ